MLSLEAHLLAGAPDSVFYIPDFITEAEEASLLANIARTPAPRWTQLANRRLQNWGGLPHPKGMIAEPMPAWLQVYVDKVNKMGIFSSEEAIEDKVNKPKLANHVLLNEYLPGQGIMAHLDGAMFHPTISTISLGSHTVLNFYRELDTDMTGPGGLEDRLVTSVLVRPRSLLVLRDDMYTKYLHGIEETHEDTMTLDCNIIEHSVTETDYTLFHVNWIPSSPRIVVCGSTLSGEGILKVYSLASKGLTELSTYKRQKAVRCGTFEGSSLEDRSYVTGDFDGNLAVWDLEEDRPVEDVRGAHREMINCVAGAEGGSIVSGGREGEVRVWDRRDMRRCVLNMVDRDTSHDAWAVSMRGQEVCAGYSNGDIRLFDMRAGAASWETSLPGGGLTHLTLLGDKRLTGAGAGGLASVWDLQTRHKTLGYTRTDLKLEKSIIWNLSPSPDDSRVMMATLGSGAARLVHFRPPGHRVMIGRDGTNVGTPGEMKPVTSVQMSDRPVTSFHWSGDRPGLGVATGFDQKIRVLMVTNIARREDSP